LYVIVSYSKSVNSVESGEGFSWYTTEYVTYTNLISSVLGEKAM